MIQHDLKIDPEYLIHIESGGKRFEVRKDDRGFQEQDTLALRGWENGCYMGRVVYGRIQYILRDFVGLKKGYVVLGFKMICAAWEDSE